MSHTELCKMPKHQTKDPAWSYCNHAKQEMVMLISIAVDNFLFVRLQPVNTEGTVICVRYP